MSNRTVSLPEDQVTIENLMALSERGVRTVEVEYYDDIAEGGFREWLMNINERNVLLAKLEERKEFCSYYNLEKEELYYFTIRKHMLELPFEAECEVYSQMMETINMIEGDKSYVEKMAEFETEAAIYLKRICIIP